MAVDKPLARDRDTSIEAFVHQAPADHYAPLITQVALHHLRSRLYLQQPCRVAPVRLTEIEPGLYQSTEKGAERFVAISGQGQIALAERVTEYAQQLRGTLAKNGTTTSERRFVEGLLAGAERLRSEAELSKTPYDPGHCNSGAQVLATAYSNWGTEAFATAGVTLDFSPVTPTSNWAFAGTESAPGNTSNTVGLDTAVATVFAAYSCYAAAISSVTCPNGDGRGAAAFQYSSHPGAPNFCYAP